MAATSGLLQKATAYRKSLTILKDIEREVAQARTQVTPELLRFTPRKRGGLLPLVVNLAAAVVIAAGVLIAVWQSRQREQTIAAAPVALTTAEGKLLEALKQESQEQLASKDREIADIRGRLAGLDQERERLRAEADARIRLKEQELEDSLAAALESERAKLEASGLSAAAVNKRLADLEASSKAAAERQLASLRQQAEADRAAQEAAAEKLRAEYQQGLAQAQADRNRIQEDAARRQSELEAGYRQKQLALEQDKAAAVSQLEQLRRQQEKEQLVLDQFLSFYREARDRLAEGRAEDAMQVLSRFRAYLDDPGVAALSAVSKRRSVEVFLIGSLEEIARSRAKAQEDAMAAQSLVASASLVTAVAALVQQGDAFFAQRDYARAREVYLSALARIPAVETGYDRLKDIERVAAEQGRREVAALFADAGAAYTAGDFDRALDRYGRGLELLQAERGTVDTLLAQLQQIGALRERAAASAAKPDAADAQRQALQAELAAATAERDRAQAALAAAAGERDKAQSDLAAATAERDRVKTELATAAAERDRARTDLAAVKAERDKAMADLAAAVARGEQVGLQAATAQNRRAGTLAELAVLRQRAARAVPAAETSREQLIELLNTKLLVQKVLVSDAVIAQYPELSGQLDRYLEALVAEQRGDAELETLRDLDAMLAGLAGAGEVSGAALLDTPAADQQQLLLGILDKLKTLIE